MKKTYTIIELNEFIPVYSDIVARRNGSRYIDKIWECLDVLEYFEEYEKCDDILSIIKKLGIKRHNSRDLNKSFS